jgi:hypothetical protein
MIRSSSEWYTKTERQNKLKKIENHRKKIKCKEGHTRNRKINVFLQRETRKRAQGVGIFFKILHS